MTKTTYYELNNQLNIPDEKGRIQLDKDKEAVKAFFKEHVNQNTVFFHSLKEKLEYLVENDYIESELINKYDFKFVKSLFEFIYNKRFRFDSFMGAYKFYRQYALKTDDGQRYLERYEDRIAFNALLFGDGNEALALDIANEMIERRYQPATPSFMNAGRKRRGEYTSCFLIDVGDSMNDISRAINSSLQLSKIAGGVGLNLTNLRPAGAPIKGYEGMASGVVPVMKILENSFAYANQMGSRAGSGAIYLNIFHQDILSMLATRKENADDKVRIKMLSMGLVVPDKFYELVEKNLPMHLFSPYDIEKEYGELFSQFDITGRYDELVLNPRIGKKTINARDLDTEISKLQQESGYPYIMNYDTTNRENPLSGTISMSNLCVTGDTELLTSEGYMSAKDLYESQKEIRVHIDERTVSMDGISRGTRVVDAIPVQLTAKQADVFEIKTKQGFSIKSTEWHKYYVLEEDNKVKKKQMNELKVGDKLLVQSGRMQEFGNNTDSDLAYLMGIIAGDGTLYDGRNGVKYARIILHEDKVEFKDVIEDKLNKVISKYITSEEVKHNAIMVPKFSEKKQNGKTFLSMQSGVLGKILFESFGLDKNNKLSIPSYVKQGTLEVQAAYLSGLFQMDACVNPSPKYLSMSIELATISEKFAQDIQKMLLGLGSYSTIYKRKERIAMLPDSNRNMKETPTSATYRITLQDRKSRENFYKLIELKTKDKVKFEEFNKILSPTSRNPKHKYTAEISSIEFFGVEDVYDTTQEDYHSLIFDGIVTGNCSEILQVQRPSTVNDDQTYKVMGTDISCNLGSLNIPNLMNSEDIGKSVEVAVRALTWVADNLSVPTVPTIEKGNAELRTIGLGHMGLHSYMAINQIQYGSKESVDLTDHLFELINFHSIRASNEIAKETGEAFVGFEKSDYANGKYFDKYTQPRFKSKYEKVRDLFDSILPTVEDWEKLKNSVQEHGLYHGYRSATAPTGSISYVNETSASVHPITQLIEKRKEGKTGSTFYPAPQLSDKTIPYYKSAYDTSMLDVIDVYAAAQKHIDQGMSLTLFMRSEIPAGLYPWKPDGGKMTTKDLSLIRHYAFKKGIKTLYYVRTHTDDGEEIGANQCESCVV